MPPSIPVVLFRYFISRRFSVKLCSRMLLQHRLTRSLLLLAVVGSSALAQEPANRINPLPSPKPSAAPVISRPEPTETPLPHVELSKDILLKVLTAETAAQRGDWQSAYISFMALAQQSRDPRLAKRATDLAMEAQSADEAAAAIRLWRELAPNSGEAEQYFLSVLVVKNDYAELEKLLGQQMHTAASKELPLLIHQVQRLLARTQDSQRAFQTLKNVLERVPASIDSHIALAHAAWRNQDKVIAQQEAQLARRLDPDSELAVLTQAQVSERAQAREQLEEFLRTHPDSQEIQLAYGTMLIEAKQLSAAKQVFLTLLAQQTAKQSPTASTLYAIGAIEFELEKFDSAETYFQGFLKALTPNLDPSNAYINLAQIALHKHDKKAADQWLAKIEHHDGKNPIWLKVQLRRAFLLASEEGAGAARRFLQQVTTFNDNEKLQVLVAEVQILRDAGQYLEALTLTQLGLGEFQSSTELLYQFSLITEILKRYDEMELALRQLIQVAPDNAFAFNALGYSFADRNIKLDEAQKLIERAVQLAPGDAYILDSLAWLKFRQKHIDEAEQILRRAVAIKHDLEITLHLAEVLWAQESKKQEALTLLSELKKNFQGSELIAQTLQRLAIPASHLHE